MLISVGGVVQLVNYLLCKHKDLRSSPEHPSQSRETQPAAGWLPLQEADP